MAFISYSFPGGVNIKKIQVNGIDFNVEVTIKRGNKNTYLRVRNGVLSFTSPRNLSDSAIKQMILANYNSIVKSLSTPPSNLNQLHFFGKTYDLKIILSERNQVLLDDSEIRILTKKKENSYIQKIVSLFYANELSKFVEKNILMIKSQFHIDYEVTFDYKNVKTYFGECFTKRRHIILATKLAKYEPYYILSVIYHEFGHFFYQNHSMQFYALLEQVFPNYRETQRNLRKIKYNDAF